MKVVIVEPNKKPYAKDIPAELNEYQQIVGGYIECVYPYDDNAIMVCNDEGKLDCLPLNRKIYDGDGNAVDIVAGTFFIVGDDRENCDFCSLTDEQIKKYLAMYDEVENIDADNPLAKPTAAFYPLSMDDFFTMINLDDFIG